MCEIVRNSRTSSAFLASSFSSFAIRPRPNQVFQRTSPDCMAGTIMRFSRTDMDANSCAIWKVRSRPFWKSSCGCKPVMSSPSIRIRPEVGAYRPAITLNKVVFPAPLGPIKPVMEPSAISSDTPSTARSPSKCLCRSSTRIIPVPYIITGPFLSADIQPLEGPNNGGGTE